MRFSSCWLKREAKAARRLDGRGATPWRDLRRCHRRVQVRMLLLELGAKRDPESARIGQKRIDLIGLERGIEGDLVILLVRQVCTPHFHRPLAVRCTEA